MEDLVQYRLRTSKLPYMEQKKEELLSMSSYVKTTGCRRYAIQKVLDQVAVSCSSSPDYALCDNCHLTMTKVFPPGIQNPDRHEMSMRTSNITPGSDTDDDEECNTYTIQKTDVEQRSGSHGNNHGFNGGSNGFNGGSHGNNGGSHGFNGGSHGFSVDSRGSNHGSYGSNQGFVSASSLNVQASTNTNNQRLKQTETILQDIMNYLDWLDGRCAVCTLKQIWNSEVNKASLKHSKSSCVGIGKCFKCGVRGCARDKCPVFMEIKKKYGEVCYMCFLYNDKIYGNKFHNTASSSMACGNKKAKDNIMCVCFWIWEATTTNNKTKGWMQQFVPESSLATYEDYTKYLLEKDSNTGLYNYYTVLSNLYRFLVDNNHQMTPNDL